MTSALNPEQSLLDLMKANLAKTVYLKKALLSSAEEELCKATHTNDALKPLSSKQSRLC